MGESWSVLRILLSPLALLVRPWFGQCEIHYRACIGPGLRILHPSLGVVISAHTIAGSDLILVGGNFIGLRGGLQNGPILIGNHVELGANASIIGPVKLGSNILIGAGAVVVKDACDGETLVGVPARPLPLKSSL